MRFVAVRWSLPLVLAFGAGNLGLACDTAGSSANGGTGGASTGATAGTSDGGSDANGMTGGASGGPGAGGSAGTTGGTGATTTGGGGGSAATGVGGDAGSTASGGAGGTGATNAGSSARDGTGATRGTGAAGSGASAGGGAPSAGGGNAGSTAAGGAGPASGPFTLAWQDDFDTLDTSRWALQTFSFDGNLAQFSTANATTANGILSIALTPEASDTVKPYRGVELRSVPTITYGKVEARIRFARGSGVVSGLVLIYTPWPADDWNEIDIEHLGKQSDAVQLNCQVYTGPPTTPPVTTSVSPTQDPLITPLGFDAEADFHVYAMEWTPTDIKFTADGSLLRAWSSEIARMKLPQNILFTIWASSSADWAGALGTDSAPTTADIDWLKVYSFNG